MSPAKTQELPRPAESSRGETFERIHGLDSLRALAMFLGIVLHAALSFASELPIPWPALDVSRHWSFDLVIGFIHGFRMQLFFLLAGFFARLVCERLGPSGFFKQRLKRIGVPFVAGWFAMAPMFAIIWTWGIQKMPNAGEIGRLMEEQKQGIPTAHLWFLEYLLLFYMLALGFLWLARFVPEGIKFRAKGLSAKVLQSPLRTPLLAALCCAPLWNGPFWGEPETPGIRLAPRLGALAYYGLFFGVGWLAHRRRELLASFQRYAVSTAIIAVIGYCVYGAIISLRPIPGPGHPNFLALKFIANFCAAFYAWGVSFAAIGLFMRFAAAPQRWGRYMADASYWCYLAHLPLVNVFQILAAPIQAPGWIKFTLILIATMALLLVTYEYCVRYTFIGRTLNGPRTRGPAWKET